MKKSFRILVYTIHQWPLTERNLQVFFVGFFFVLHKWYINGTIICMKIDQLLKCWIFFIMT